MTRDLHLESNIPSTLLDILSCSLLRCQTVECCGIMGVVSTEHATSNDARHLLLEVRSGSLPQSLEVTIRLAPDFVSQRSSTYFATLVDLSVSRGSFDCIVPADKIIDPRRCNTAATNEKKMSCSACFRC